MLPAGERVVEAIFGYSSVVSSSANTPDTTPTALDNELKWGYSLGSDRTVLLRWPNSTADPDVRIGSWIADVTYERTQLAEAARFRPTATDPNGFSYKAVGGTPVYKLYPGQRCHWYRVVSKSTPRNGRAFSNDPQGVLFREMTLVIETPVKSKTILTNLAEPAHVNAALISSYVVQVVPRSFTSK
jgi:hypothetical protein